MSTCRHHKDREADSVCSVCGGYFCKECVGERYYPQPGLICHHCSGEKPFEPPEESDEGKEPDPVAEPRESSVFLHSLRDRLLVSSEWLVLLLCLAIITYPFLGDKNRADEELVLESGEPEDLTTYCLGRLDDMEYRGVTATLAKVKEVCPYPIEVAEDDNAILVTSPDEFLYGFTEIMVEKSPITLTILE